MSDYKCFCVKPIFEDELTAQDGTKYTVRYVLCTDLGSCSLDAVEVVDQQTYTAFKCSGDCKNNCKCTLFRLKVGGPNFDPAKAKWERLVKADTTVRFEDHSTYRCFCLK